MLLHAISIYSMLYVNESMMDKFSALELEIFLGFQVTLAYFSHLQLLWKVVHLFTSTLHRSLIAAHPSDGRDLEKGREPSTRFLDGKAGANIETHLTCAVELERLV